MIVSVDEEKSFDRSQHPFIIFKNFMQTICKLGIENW